MTGRRNAVLIAGAAAALALGLSACGSSTMSDVASSASSIASSASSAVSSGASAASSVASSAMSSAANAAGLTEGTLASVCTEIDSVMLNNPDADPAGTAAKLDEIAAKISTPDAELVENVAVAYSALAANPADTAAQEQLQSSASALGAGCESATTAPKPN